MLIIYQSCHTIVKQDDSHYTWLTLLRFYLSLGIWLSPSWMLPIAANANAFLASVPKKWAISGKMEMTVTFSSTIPVDTFSLSYNHTYHTYHTRVFHIYVPIRRWQTFSLFALSELVCTKQVFYPIHYSLLIYPKLTPFWSITDGQTKFFTPYSLKNKFTECVGPCPQAQLYWAGQTMGWMADWTRLDEKAHYLCVLHFIWASCTQHKSSCRIKLTSWLFYN